jgi:hypothetical protein
LKRGSLFVHVKKRNVDTDVSRYRGQVGGLKRAIRNGERPADDGALEEAEENLRVAVRVAHIMKIVDGAPPLTARQREKLSALLRSDQTLPARVPRRARGLAASPVVGD